MTADLPAILSPARLETSVVAAPTVTSLHSDGGREAARGTQARLETRSIKAGCCAPASFACVNAGWQTNTPPIDSVFQSAVILRSRDDRQ